MNKEVKFTSTKYFKVLREPNLNDSVDQTFKNTISLIKKSSDLNKSNISINANSSILSLNEEYTNPNKIKSNKNKYSREYNQTLSFKINKSKLKFKTLLSKKRIYQNNEISKSIENKIFSIEKVKKNDLKSKDSEFLDKSCNKIIFNISKVNKIKELKEINIHENIWFQKNNFYVIKNIINNNSKYYLELIEDNNKIGLISKSYYYEIRNTNKFYTITNILNFIFSCYFNKTRNFASNIVKISVYYLCKNLKFKNLKIDKFFNELEVFFTKAQIFLNSFTNMEIIGTAFNQNLDNYFLLRSGENTKEICNVFKEYIPSNLLNSVHSLKNFKFESNSIFSTNLKFLKKDNFDEISFYKSMNFLVETCLKTSIYNLIGININCSILELVNEEILKKVDESLMLNLDLINLLKELNKNRFILSLESNYDLCYLYKIICENDNKNSLVIYISDKENYDLGGFSNEINKSIGSAFIYCFPIIKGDIRNNFTDPFLVKDLRRKVTAKVFKIVNL